ncbi:MAG: TOBE domain-containing protein [Campylobacteraceae bacterium]|nr:TOBE domain-containing protein [Campylobacteraceae bacterium]
MLANHFKKGDEIAVGFKESAVAVSRNGNENLSYSNQILVEIESLVEGEILTKVVGKVFDDELKITSVITASSAKRLELKVGDKVTFLVKATDMFVV